MSRSESVQTTSNAVDGSIIAAYFVTDHKEFRIFQDGIKRFSVKVCIYSGSKKTQETPRRGLLGPQRTRIFRPRHRAGQSIS